MNKLEVELTEALIKVEQSTARICGAYGGDALLSKELNKDLIAFKIVLFKLLSSNNED